jgi:hypothetical protein
MIIFDNYWFLRFQKERINIFQEFYTVTPGGRGIVELDFCIVPIMEELNFCEFCMVPISEELNF